jgi:hypothetical protein
MNTSARGSNGVGIEVEALEMVARRAPIVVDDTLAPLLMK